MSKYILIDLEDTITIHNDLDRIKSIMLEWLKFNCVSNPIEIYENPNFKTRSTRLELLGISEEQYKKWYQNFNDVEFEEYYKKYKNNEININKDTIEFIKKSKIPLILVSNSSPKWIDYILEEYNLTKYFCYIFHRKYLLDDIKKPDKKVIQLIQEELNDDISNDSIVIGDSVIDYKFALNCGLNFIGVYNKIEDTIHFNNFKELYNYINK